MSQQVLTERQVQNTLSNNNTSNTTNSNSKEGKAQQQPAKSLALARLQAQRVDRRRDPNNTTATATQQPNTLLSSSPLPLVCSQNATNKPRLRGLRITTTAGSGMQRQAPSSRPSSVRGSMDNLQQLQSPQLKQQPAPLLLAATTAAVQAPALSSNVRSAPLSKQPSPSRAVVRSQQAGGGLLLQVHGAGAASRQNQQQQQQHGDRRSSSSIRVTPVKQQAALCATGVRPAPRARGAVPAADAGAGGPSAGLLGCGAAWQELEAAVAGARAAPQPLGSNLQQRRQVQQSRQAVAQLVVRQWRWFSSSRRQRKAADCMCSRRLMSAAWRGLSQEVQRMQLLGCQASLHATKQSFMLLSRTFTAWQQLVALRRRLEAVTDTLQAHRHRQTLRAALLGWVECVQLRRRQRQLLLRAEACHVFMTLLRVLQQWRAHTTDKQVARLRAARADQHWQHVVCSHVLHTWQAKAVRGAAKWQALAQALCFHKQQLLSRALQGWALSVHQQQQARASACAVLERVAQRLQSQGAAAALHAWLRAAQLQAEQREVVLAAAAARQQRRQQQVLQRWHELVLYRQQLDAAAHALQQLQPAWWLAHSFRRWRGIAQVLAGQRGEELQELVQLRACLGTWLKYTDRRHHKAMQLAAATSALNRLKLARLLPAWQDVTSHKQQQHQHAQAAQQHYNMRLQQRVLAAWQEAAAEAVVERLQLTAAAELHRLRLLTAGLRGLAWYPRYCERKAAAPQHYLSSLLQRAFTAWRDRTADKQHAEQQRRLAVRHHYLSTLGKVLCAWQEALQAAGQQQRQLAAAHRHHETQLLTAVLQAWRGPLLQELREQRQQEAAADALSSKHLLLRCLSAWAAAVGAGRRKREQRAAAEQFRRYWLLQQGMQSFLQLQAEVQQEREALAAAAGPAIRVLNQHRQRRLLRTWLAAAGEQQREQALMARADEHTQRRLLSYSLRQWQQYVQYRRHKAALSLLASQHHSRALLAASLSAFKLRVCWAAEKRRRVFAAALHRRSWLIYRGFKAWRLCAAVSHLERILSHQPSSSGQHLTTLQPAAASNSQSDGSTGQHYQQQHYPQPQPTVVAAAVVEASCAAHRHWQEQWRNKWQQAMTPQQPQQEQQPSQLAEHAQQLSVLALPPPHPPQHQQQQHYHVPPAALSSAAATAAGGGDSFDGCDSLAQPSAQPQQAAAHTHNSSISSSINCSKRASRRQPRLPLFMQQELQQQQQLEVATGSQLRAQLQAHSFETLDLQQQQQQQQLLGGSVWGSGGGDGSALPCSQPTTPATHLQRPMSADPTQPAGQRFAVEGGELLDTCSLEQQVRPTTAQGVLDQLQPQAAKKKVRLQPRQLRPSLLDTCVRGVGGAGPGGASIADQQQQQLWGG